MYHVNGRGEARPCRAHTHQCPYGGAEDHYATLREARDAYEREQPSLFGEAERD